MKFYVGMWAHALCFMQIQGQTADLTDLQRILNRSKTKVTDSQQQNLTVRPLMQASTFRARSSGRGLDIEPGACRGGQSTMPVSSCGDTKASTRHSRKPWAMGRMCQLVYLQLRMPDERGKSDLALLDYELSTKLIEHVILIYSRQVGICKPDFTQQSVLSLCRAVSKQECFHSNLGAGDLFASQTSGLAAWKYYQASKKE